MQRIFFQLITFVENHPFKLRKIEVAGLTKLLLHFLGKADDDVPIFVDGAIDPANFDFPLVSHLVKITVSNQIVINLSKKCFSGYYNEGLGSPNLMVLILFLHILLPGTGNILKGVEDGQ